MQPYQVYTRRMSDHTSYTLRIPNQQYERIKQAAEQEQRSIHGQILWLLEKALTPKPVSDR